MCNKTVQGRGLLEKKEKCAAPLQYTSFMSCTLLLWRQKYNKNLKTATFLHINCIFHEKDFAERRNMPTFAPNKTKR